MYTFTTFLQQLFKTETTLYIDSLLNRFDFTASKLGHYGAGPFILRGCARKHPANVLVHLSLVVSKPSAIFFSYRLLFASPVSCEIMVSISRSSSHLHIWGKPIQVVRKFHLLSNKLALKTFHTREIVAQDFPSYIDFWI